MCVGVQVLVMADIDMAPYATIKEGERGTVMETTAYDVVIKWDTLHPGLWRWYNESTVIEGETLDKLRVVLPVTETPTGLYTIVPPASPWGLP
jgi:hypothetical protein